MRHRRHSYASQQLSRGVPITTVSETLGHANPNITLAIYSHALPSDNKAAAKLWNDAMADALEAREKAARARGFPALANVSKDAAKNRVIPIKSAS